MIPFPKKKYRIIYADPAWSYPKSGSKKNSRGLAKQYYPTMSLQEIKDLQVRDIADDNSTLFLWATFPKIKEALEVIEAWGFTYHNSAFVWVKKTKRGYDFFGMGYWTRANPEVCLLAIKGKPKPKDHSISQLVYAEVLEHSKKPKIIMDKIIRLCGDLPRIELFARQKTEGWDSWGNEVPTECQNKLSEVSGNSSQP